MKEIRFDKVKKSYGKTDVVKELNFTVQKGERLILLGPSGCGKSTTLRMIAGLENVSSGDMYMDDVCVNDVPSGKRNVAMVFQNYALYPHMTVTQNITYALRTKKVDQTEIERRLEDALTMLQLKGLEDRLPKDLSGGQRQRVALARAVVKRADYFLLDEPLSNLDAKLRVSARKELVKIHEKYCQTMVYVTHDQIEAMSLGDRIALLNDGVLQMLDTPVNVYNRPANIFTAQFIGAPPMNIIAMQYHQGKMVFGSLSYTLSAEWIVHIQKCDFLHLQLGIRPEHIELLGKPKENSMEATVCSIENLGAEYAVYLEFNGQEIIALSKHSNWPIGEKIFFYVLPEHLHFFNQQTTISIGYPEFMKDAEYVEIGGI